MMKQPYVATGRHPKPFTHHVNPGIDRHGRYRRVAGPPCELQPYADLGQGFFLSSLVVA
jgi:hypothetical protein